MRNNVLTIFLLVIVIYSNAQDLLWTKKCSDQQRETYGVAFSADGSRVLSGSECHPSSIRVWDASNGNMLWDYSVGGNLMCQSAVKFSSNGNYCIKYTIVSNYTLTCLLTHVNVINCYSITTVPIQ